MTTQSASPARRPAPDPRPHRVWIDATTGQLVLSASLFWTLSANWPFFGAALKGRALADPSAWGFALAMFVLVFSLHAIVLGLVAMRWTVKPVVAVVTVATAFAGYYMNAYGVVLDPTMLRNVLHTDLAETRELITVQLLIHLALYAGLPLLLLWHVRVARQRWLRAAVVRVLGLAGLLSAVLVSLYAVFQPMASLMRNHKEVRYLITPANYLWSLAAVAAAEARGAARPLEMVGQDAKPGPSWAARSKPLVVVLVVGETARAANWGLSGYARQTTPQLAKLPVVNFPSVESCGTSTEVSLPCMFAPVGRRDYDEARIRGQQSLLHVAARAGVGVNWRDNQSGCKGVCAGLTQDTVTSASSPGLCDDERCLDEGLTADMDERLKTSRGTQLWVMHMLGNHGPAYYRRYPRTFATFQPDCRNDDLRKCSVPEVVNAYDNALLYTDHVLATAIAKLRARAAQVDSVLLYVSDHGESLGEKGLFLHGMPFSMAPSEQTRVPMVMWASAGYEQAVGLPADCLVPELKRRAAQPVSHDNLFHTVLGLLDVQTQVRDAALDLTQGCRQVAAQAVR